MHFGVSGCGTGKRVRTRAACARSCAVTTLSSNVWRSSTDKTEAALRGHTPAPGRDAFKPAVAVEPAAQPAVSRRVARYAGLEHRHVDERRRRRLVDDLAGAFTGDRGAGVGG